MLIEGYEGLHASPDVPEVYRSDRIRQALERLVRLYETWDAAAPDNGRAQTAAAWRERMAGAGR